MSAYPKVTPRADIVLDPHICPKGPPSNSNTVFLTGATGFLGSHLLAELLQNTDWNIVCLVRAKDDAIATQRLAETLASTERHCPDQTARVTALCGNLSAHNFGLDAATYAQLTASIGQVIHCAAEVSWIKSYARLRGSHINGTLNAIRLACHGTTKPLHFVSTLAVCYVPDGPDAVDEAMDMSPWLEHIPLAYAQAKCVAESLLRQATQRGLPVTILRCGLICGDSVSGKSNHDDIISRMLRGAIQSGITADVDWGLDCVPVDTVAQALRILAMDRPQGLRVLHMHHDEPRLWREMTLWLRLNGYAVGFVSLVEWLDMVGDKRTGRAPDLHVLRQFFLSRPALMGGHSLTELYLESHRRRIHSASSHAYFSERGLVIPRLNAHLLNCYMLRYQQLGFLENLSGKFRTTTEQALRLSMTTGLSAALNEPQLSLDEFRASPLSGSSMLSELNSISSMGRSGLWRCDATCRRSPDSPPERIQAVLKLRASDEEQDASTLAVAELCSPTLAREFAQFLPHMAYRVSLDREIAIANDSRLAPYMPKFISPLTTEGGGPNGFMEEYLTAVDLMDSANNTQQWHTGHIEAAVYALGRIHAVWYGRTDELLQQSWIAPGVSQAMPSLWHELADFSAASFSRYAGADTHALQHRLIDELDLWWPQWMSMPRSLIHNDFNPRNLAFRRSAHGPVLCAYDWELATIGLPQYDLAELLCFVLPAACSPQDVEHWIEQHRLVLQASSGQAVLRDDWQSGFMIALRYFMVSRLPLYAMMDRFKPQPFLPIVFGNWLKLYGYLEKMELRESISTISEIE